MEFLNELRLFEFLLFAGKSFHSRAPEYRKLCLNFSLFGLRIFKLSCVFDHKTRVVE